MARILLTGLEAIHESALREGLRRIGHHAETHPAPDLTHLAGADVVFAGGPPGQYLPLLHRLHARFPLRPFIVVTRLPESEEWIDALEAGATDYCSFPLSVGQLNWILDSALPRCATAAA